MWLNVATPPRPDETLARRPDDPIEALIEEARQRARRRRWMYAVAAVVVVLAGLVAIVAFDGAAPLGDGSPPDGEAGASGGDLGVFESMRGWIFFAYGAGIAAVDPHDPSTRRTVLDKHPGISDHVSPLEWSADGRKLALVDEGESGTWVMDSTGSLINVAKAGGCCSFVYDNTGAFFDPTFDARLQFELPSLDDPVETRAVPAEVFGLHRAVWAGNGEALAFMLLDEVVVSDLESGTIRRVDWGPSPVEVGHMVWSPDGTQLLMTAPATSPRGDLPRNGKDTRGLYVVDIEGFRLRRIDPGSYVAAAWSPDGTQIAAIAATPEGGRLVVMNANGTNPHTLARMDSANFTGIAWHPLPAHHS